MWQRLVIYLFPALIDAVAAQVLFVNTVRAARMGGSAMAVAGMVTLWSLLYAFVCPLVGRWVRPGNAAAMMIGGCVTLAGASLLFLGVNRLAPMYLLVSVCSVAMAFFFTPFQVFMKAVAQNGGRSLRSSVGAYTFAWSAGFAVGPFISGFLMQLDASGAPRAVAGWQWTYILGAGTAVLTALGVWALAHLAGGSGATTEAAVEASLLKDAGETARPDLAWLGWTAGGAGIVVLSMIRGVFPVRAVSLQLSDATLGTFFFLLSAAQALCALALIRSRTWMYRPGVALGFGVLGVIGALLTGWGRTGPILYAGAVAFGLFMGALFFAFVYYAILHPRHAARNVARNELVVGLCGIVGPTLGGYLGDTVNLSFPYLMAGLLIVAAVLLQAHTLRRARN